MGMRGGGRKLHHTYTRSSLSWVIDAFHLGGAGEKGKFALVPSSSVTVLRAEKI